MKDSSHIYLPNGNPQPGPKFNYKLAWFERLIAHAAEGSAVGKRLNKLKTEYSQDEVPIERDFILEL
jgi:hypothetical protein